jgi:hypothetical protein
VIYLITGAGEPNFGDELIVLDWIEFYRSQGYKGPIFVDCKSGSGARKLHGSTENVHFGWFLKALATGDKGSISDYIRAGRQFVDAALGVSKAEDQSLAANAMQRVGKLDQPENFSSTRFVHLVGGGYINGNWNNSFSLIGAASQLSKQLGCKAVATGLGMAPLEELRSIDRMSLSRAIADFAYFEVRDDTSAKLLGKNGVKGSQMVVGLDDSFLQPPKTKSEFRGRSLHLALFGRHLEGSNGEKLMNLIKTAAADYDRVLCWQCNAADEAACASIESQLPNVKRLYNRGLLYNGMPIQSEDSMITSRFHPHLLASRAGISGFYLVHSDFYSVKHQSVVDLGSAFERYSAAKDVALPKNRSTRMAEMDPERVRQKKQVGVTIEALAKTACKY